MTGLVVFCLLGLCLGMPQVIRARQIARNPPFRSWIKDEGPLPETLAEPAPDVARDGLVWTDLDDRQVERLLSQSSS